MSSNNKLDKTGLSALWTRFFTLVKILTGDVKVSEKGTLQEQVDTLDQEISETKKSVVDGKASVASAITTKGVETASDASFDVMSENILEIKTSATLQAKTAALSTLAQTITADGGYDGLSQVTVPAVTGNATVGYVLSGYTFNSASAGIAKTGTMTNRAGTTTNGTMTQDSTYTYLAPQSNGYYTTASKLRVANSNFDITVEEKTGTTATFSKIPKGIIIVVWNSQYSSGIRDFYIVETGTIINDGTSDLKVAVTGETVVVSSSTYTIRSCTIYACV